MPWSHLNHCFLLPTATQLFGLIVCVSAMKWTAKMWFMFNPRGNNMQGLAWQTASWNWPSHNGWHNTFGPTGCYCRTGAKFSQVNASRERGSWTQQADKSSLPGGWEGKKKAEKEMLWNPSEKGKRNSGGRKKEMAFPHKSLHFPCLLYIFLLAFFLKCPLPISLAHVLLQCLVWKTS